MGDIHGDIDKTLQALVQIGLLTKDSDTQFTWKPSAKEGEAIVYFAQTGDIFDRGAFGEQVAQLLHKNGDYSMKDGKSKTINIKGTIPKDYLLLTLGNHDAFPLLGKSISSSQFSQLGTDGFKTILKCDGELRLLLKGTPIVRIFGDTVFLHGGISKAWATKAKADFDKKDEDDTVTTECTADGGVTVAECTISGNELIRNLNEAAMSVLWGKDNRYCAKTDEDYAAYMKTKHGRSQFDNTKKPTFLGDADQNVETMTQVEHDQADPANCPLWYRSWTYSITTPEHYELDEGRKQEYADTLTILGVKRMVMGHQIVKAGIAVTNEGTLIGIDVGQSYKYKNNGLQLLKIEYDGPDAKKMSTLKWTKDGVGPVTAEAWTA